MKANVTVNLLWKIGWEVLLFQNITRLLMHKQLCRL